MSKVFETKQDELRHFKTISCKSELNQRAKNIG